VSLEVAETIRRGHIAMWDRQVGYIEGARSFRVGTLCLGSFVRPTSLPTNIWCPFWAACLATALA
jgi:hypothetical protein